MVKLYIQLYPDHAIMKSIIFKSALLTTGWAQNVRIDIDERGFVSQISENAEATVDVVSGYAIPGMNNIHSHAFQRAMAGLAEYSTSSNDSFWTWRDIMYRFAAKISPNDLYAVASQLYVEMLKGGYVSVSEFHYLHHDEIGSMNMSRAIMNAAKDAGIALCHLPVLYMASGFGGNPLKEEQKRFGHTVDDYLMLLEGLRSEVNQNANQHLGMAFHSLRAVEIEAMKKCLMVRKDGPIHIHIAEQKQEVNDSVAHYGMRPVEWLYNNFDVDKNWCLVHATHLNGGEITAIARSGAVAGLCPTTEANLGDGLFPLPEYLETGGEVAIGSDSHISVSVSEELRLLEYGQRLSHQKRNIASSIDNPHTGTNLYLKSASGGARASGFDNGAIEVGRRADIVVLDDRSPILVGTPDESVFDRYIFSGNVNVTRDVYIAGEKVISDYKHVHEEQIFEKFRQTVEGLQKMLD